LLPKPLHAFDVVDGALLPRWLTSRDEPWLAALLAEVPALAGRPIAEWNRACAEEWAPRAEANGAGARAAAGVLHALGRMWRTEISARVPPPDARRVAFEHAARIAARDEALAEAARALRVAPHELEEALFADRAVRRVLRPPAEWPSASELKDRYNLLLAQSLLMRAHVLCIRVRCHTHAVVRFAKLRRLLCTCAPDGEGTALHVSGPLAVLRHTTKYGHALASFLPAVLATPGWSLEATCLLGRDLRTAALSLSAKDPLAVTHALPREADSEIEKRLAADVRALRAGWAIERETAAIQVVLDDGSERVVHPDFTLVRGGARVHVEIVGYFTPEYLETKMRVVRAAAAHRIVVCVDASLGVMGDFDAERVLLFRRTVDARKLLDLAERVVLAPRAGQEPVRAGNTRPPMDEGTPR
jgi:predicted nuclease of restriction endonuclease-like RecB superfamily